MDDTVANTPVLGGSTTYNKGKTSVAISYKHHPDFVLQDTAAVRMDLPPITELGSCIRLNHEFCLYLPLWCSICFMCRAPSYSPVAPYAKTSSSVNHARNRVKELVQVLLVVAIQCASFQNKSRQNLVWLASLDQKGVCTSLASLGRPTQLKVMVA